MKKNLLTIIVLSSVLYYCGQVSKSKPAAFSKDKEAPKISDVTGSQKSAETSIDSYIDTKYLYVDNNGKLITIQNGLPIGGLRYTDPNDKEYHYAIFWTRIINETDNPLELKIDFLDSYEVPYFPDKHYKILVPLDTMTTGKVDLFNYGLTDLGAFLDNSINKPSSLKRTISPKDSSGFYFVKLGLVSEGPYGSGNILRTGLSLNGEDLFYRVSVYNSVKPPIIIGEKEIDCGKINLKKLKLQK